MAVCGVKLSPDIDKPAHVVPWWVQNVRKRGCLSFCITSGFVPVCLWITEVYGCHGRGVVT